MVNPGTPIPINDNAPSTISTKPWWLPDRKVYSGGVAGLATAMILAVSNHYGYSLQAYADSLFGPGAINVAATLIGLISLVAAYIIPPSYHDIYTKLNDRIIALGYKDPRVLVSPAGVEAQLPKVVIPVQKAA